MTDEFRDNMLEALDEIGDSLNELLDYAYDARETDTSELLERLIASLKQAHAHLGEAAGALST